MDKVSFHEILLLFLMTISVQHLFMLVFSHLLSSFFYNTAHNRFSLNDFGINPIQDIL